MDREERILFTVKVHWVVQLNSSIVQQKKHILVVDDDAVNLRVAYAMLQRDYRVTCVKSGRQALEQIGKQDDIALIFLDVMMPEMSGYEVYRQLQGNFSDRSIPVVFLTGDEEIEWELEEQGIEGVSYIMKPLSLEQLLDVVERNIGNIE